MAKKKRADMPAPVGRQAEIASAPIIARDQQGAALAGEDASSGRADKNADQPAQANEPLAKQSKKETDC